MAHVTHSAQPVVGPRCDALADTVRTEHLATVPAVVLGGGGELIHWGGGINSQVTHNKVQ